MRALVVEDENVSRKMLLMVFGNAPDMPWTWPMMASRPVMAENNEYDLVVLDLMLPKLPDLFSGRSIVSRDTKLPC